VDSYCTLILIQLKSIAKLYIVDNTKIFITTQKNEKYLTLFDTQDHRSLHFFLKNNRISAFRAILPALETKRPN